jgi:hypothetical protein
LPQPKGSPGIEVGQANLRSVLGDPAGTQGPSSAVDRAWVGETAACPTARSSPPAIADSNRRYLQVFAEHQWGLAEKQAEAEAKESASRTP